MKLKGERCEVEEPQAPDGDLDCWEANHLSAEESEGDHQREEVTPGWIGTKGRKYKTDQHEQAHTAEQAIDPTILLNPAAEDSMQQNYPPKTQR